MSLKKNGLNFYSKLFELLLRYEVDNLLFSISKMALLIDSRLNNWILNVGERSGCSCTMLKYILTKYAEVEASEVVIKNLLDKSLDLKEVLQSIEYDMNKIINYNKDNLRMKKQIRTYEEVVTLIQKTKKQ